MSLLEDELKYYSFFSYHFNEDDQQSTIHNNEFAYCEANDPISHNQFVKSRFMQRSHLEMILNSNATRNEDRFNAILPSWNKYYQLLKNVSDWNIDDMTSVRLKLYEIMDDDDDLWDKATLLHAYKYGKILPTFANDYDMYLKIIEKVDYNNDEYKQFEESLLRYINNEEAIKMKQPMDEFKMNSKSIWNENLTSIQFERHHCYLSVQPKNYFITKEHSYNKDEYQSKLSLDNDDEIHCVFIPFFTSNLPDYINYPCMYLRGSNVYLIGSKEKNKRMLFNDDNSFIYISENFYTDDYTFNIY